METVLVCDDDIAILESIEIYLKAEGFNVLKAESGEQALNIIAQNEIQCLVLDIMMPGIDGLQTTLKIREQKKNFPIIMLSAKSEDTDKIAGLGFGADDYVTKPFDAKEVMARITAVLRRSKGENGTTAQEKKIVSYDKLEINIENYEMKVNGVVVDTPPKELELIYHFASNPNRVYTRDQLLDEVWGFDYYGDSRTVDVHVKRLREKLEGVSDKWSLKTVWGVGYKFELKNTVPNTK